MKKAVLKRKERTGIFPAFNLPQQKFSNILSAIYSKNLQSLKSLMTSPNFNPSDIHYREEYFLRVACAQGSLEIAEFLLSSPELKEHANLYTPYHEVFAAAIRSENQGLIYYLCEVTEDIRGFLGVALNDHRIIPSAINILKMRLFEDQLRRNLPQKPYRQHQPKI